MLWELRYVSEWFTGDDIFLQKAEYLDMSLGDMHNEWYLIFFPLFFSEIYLNIFFFTYVGTLHLEIDLWLIDLGVLTAILRMVMEKTEAMIEMKAQGVVTGMELEGQLVMREEATGRGQVLTIGQEGEVAPLPLIAIEVLNSNDNLVNRSNVLVIMHGT